MRQPKNNGLHVTIPAECGCLHGHSLGCTNGKETVHLISISKYSPCGARVSRDIGEEATLYPSSYMIALVTCSDCQDVIDDIVLQSKPKRRNVRK